MIRRDEKKSQRYATSHRMRVVASVAITLGAAIAFQFQMEDLESVRAGSSRPTAPESSRPVLNLTVIDAESKMPIPARFSIEVDDTAYYPLELNNHGLRFVSIHESKNQRYTVTYSRGTGAVEIVLPNDAQHVTVHATRGFEYRPASISIPINSAENIFLAQIELERWSDLFDRGWVASDAHIHYDRLQKAGDADWLTMLAADGLEQGHFMVLKGGKVPGIWARQYAYGAEGEATDGRRMIRSGEEYRDSAQGHINLLGLDEVIQPISTGGMGEPPVRENYPPLNDVLRQTRRLNGLAGVAHGGSLGRHPTATCDATLGAVDFFEIGNAHLYALDLWYRLMNCGFVIPPAAGTDLPNFPFRENWQPFLGSMRMYAQTSGKPDFESWKEAVRAGRVFITSGPIVSFQVNGRGAGELIRLPATGGELMIEATISSPVGMSAMELIRNGEIATASIEKSNSDGIHKWRIRHQIQINESCWLAVRGEGVPIPAMEASVQNRESWIKTDAIAHSGIVRVEVGNQPIRSVNDADHLIQMLRQQQEFYRTNGRYLQAEHRLRVLDLFDEAASELEKRR